MDELVVADLVRVDSLVSVPDWFEVLLGPDWADISVTVAVDAFKVEVLVCIEEVPVPGIDITEAVSVAVDARSSPFNVVWPTSVKALVSLLLRSCRENGKVGLLEMMGVFSSSSTVC